MRATTGLILTLFCTILLIQITTSKLETFTEWLEAEAEWDNFKAAFEKSYSSDKEEQYHRRIFHARLQHIRAHNQEFKEGKKSFELGVNSRSDEPLSSVMATPLWKKYGSSCQIPPRFEAVSVDNEIDWRKNGTVSRVKNQGARCSHGSQIFAAVDAIESAYTFKTKKQVELSAQQVMDCMHYACGGADVYHALFYVLEAAGIESEKSYPFTGYPGKCKFDKNDVAVVVNELRPLSGCDENQLKWFIRRSGPAATTIDASHESFLSYKSGVYNEPQCNRTAGAHGMLIVGYGTDKTEGDYWILKNRWGESWGEKGYMRIARNRGDKCGVSVNPIFAYMDID